MKEARQLSLFDDEVGKPKVRRPKQKTGGSQNPIIFRDYESFVTKFSDKPKTTDDCYTPQDVYEAVVQYVSEVYDMRGKVILRPFYPGGDYENAEYPENGVVIDNPPFSIFMKVVKFYVARNIPFFLFGPGMTIFSVCNYCTAVIINRQIEFHNGAVVRVNFASNLFGDNVAMTAIRLNELIGMCESQNTKANLPQYDYPNELLSCSDMMIIAKGNEDFSVRRNECVTVKRIGGRDLFGEHLLISRTQAERKQNAKQTAKQNAKQTAKHVINVELDKKERRLVDSMS